MVIGAVGPLFQFAVDSDGGVSCSTILATCGDKRISLLIEPGLGGAADLIQQVDVEPREVCPGAPVRVAVQSKHPEFADARVDVNIQGRMGQPQYVQFPGGPGTRLITVVATTEDHFIDHEVVEIEVINCDGGLPTPIIYVSPNPYGDHLFDFEVTNASDLGSIRVYEWDFGDGRMQRTAHPYVSHDYAGSLDPQALYTLLDATLRIQPDSGPDLMVHKSVSLWNMYAFNVRRGIIQPPVNGPRTLEVRGGDLTATFDIDNLEDTTLMLRNRWVELQSCDPDIDPAAGEVLDIEVSIPARQGHQETVAVPESVREDGICGVAVHLTGSDAKGRQVVSAAYFEIQDNPFMRIAVDDPARRAILNYVAEAGLTSDPDRITDEQLHVLAKQGLINYPYAAPPPVPTTLTSPLSALLDDPGVDAIGERCTPHEVPPREGVTCQTSGEWELVQPHLANGLRGDTVLSSGCGMIGKLMMQVSPPQKFSHSGMMTRNYFEIRHSTASEDRLQDYPVGTFGEPTDGFREDILKFGWPGMITQSIDEAYNGQRMIDPETGKNYVVSGFNEDPRLCAGDVSLVHPHVIRPLAVAGPQDEVRSTLHAVADEMLAIDGHYRFFAYTDAAIALPGRVRDFVAPAFAQWAEDTLPTVCSNAIWLAMRRIGLLPEGPELEPSDFLLGAQVDDQTENGLYFYTEAERKAAAHFLYGYIYNTAYEESGWLGRLLTDAPDDIASQIVNCFGSDDCSVSAKDSDAWKSPGPGRAVSVDDMFFWDPPPTGVYGHNEPLVYRTGRFMRVHRWAASEATGTISTHVVDREGRPVTDADVTLTSLDIHHVTDIDGTARFLAVPGGTYEVKAQKLIDGLLWEVSELVTVEVTADTTVELVLGPPPRNNRRVTLAGNMFMVDDEDFGGDETLNVPIHVVLDVNPSHTRETTTVSACAGDELRVTINIEVRLLADNVSIEAFVEARMYEGTDCDTTDHEDTAAALVTVAEDGSVSESLHLLNREFNSPDRSDIGLTVTNVRQP
jgi:hypothetical protein